MILRALWWRPSLRRPLRAAATVLGVAAGVAALCSTLLATRAAVASLGRDVEVLAGAARLEVTRPGGVAIADLGRLRALCGEVLLAPVVEGTALIPALGERVRLLGIDPLSEASVRPASLAAPPESAASFLAGEGVAVSRRLARELALSDGDALELLVRAERVRLRIVYVFDPPEPSAAWDRVVLIDVARAQELFGRLDRLDRLELVPRAGTSAATDRPRHLPELAARVRASLPAGYRVAGAEARAAEGEELVRALDFNLTALSGVSLIVGAVLVATTLATSVVQRRAAIALCVSLGASRAQLARAVLCEAGAIGLAGGALGVLLGERAARATLGAVQSSIATVAEDALGGELVLEPRWVVLGLLVGLLAALAAAWVPLREAWRTPPLQGLARAGEERAGPAQLTRHALALGCALILAWLAALAPPLGGRPIGGLASALFLLAAWLALAEPLVALLARARPARAGTLRPAALRVAQAALASGTRRAAWAAGAVGVAVALAVSMGALTSSFRRALTEWTAQTLRADLHVHPLAPEGGLASGTLHPEVEGAARARFGAQNVDAYRAAAAYVGSERVELGAGDFSVLAREGGVPFLDGRPSGEVFAQALASGGLLVNEPFARRFGVARGERVRLETGGGVLERAIEGVYRDYSGHLGRAVIDQAAFAALLPEEGAKSLAIYLPQGVEPSAARSALAADLGERFAVALRLSGEMRGQVLAVFDRTFAITVALRIVASLVAAIAVVTVLGALALERRRELGVLRAIGASRAQVVGVVLAQAGLLGLAGALGGLAVGLAVGYVMVTVVNVQSFGWSMPFAPSWGGVLATAALVLPACVLGGLLPAWTALRRAPREVLADG